MLTITERLDVADQQHPVTDRAVQDAVLLVACVYAGRDRSVWGGDRALTFWDRFPDRVKAACYRGPSLGHWWEAMTRQLGTQPPTQLIDRMALDAVLASDPKPILAVLRDQPQLLCLRVRLAWQLTREN